MAAGSPWPMIHAERKALIADLQRIPADSWKAPSLCAGWRVRDVLGHLTSTAGLTPPRFFLGFLRSGFRFNAMLEKAVEGEAAGSPADQLRRFTELAGATSGPPGPVDSWLGETIIHAEDIRRPLGIVHDYDTAAVVRVAQFYQGSNLIVGAKNRIAGLRLRATDADWSTGEGPEVAGPVLSLVLAMTGRGVAMADLDGAGAATLRSRI